MLDVPALASKTGGNMYKRGKVDALRNALQCLRLLLQLPHFGVMDCCLTKRERFGGCRNLY